MQESTRNFLLEQILISCYSINTSSKAHVKGGDIMNNPRDYSRPMTIKFKGIQGLQAYIKLTKTPPIKYDANKKAEEALQALRKQGAKL